MDAMDRTTKPGLALTRPLVQAVRTAGGEIRIAAADEPRLRMQAGRAVRGLCAGRPFTYTPGDLDLLAPGDAHAWVEHDPGLSLVVTLPTALLLRTARELGLPESQAGIAPRHQFRDAQLEQLALALEAERRQGFGNGGLYLESLATALSVRLLATARRRVRLPAALPAVRRARVLEYIEAHLDEDLSLARLAEVAHSSVSHFKVLFRRALGVAPHAYVMQRRVQRAADLLRQGRLSASQVALEAGFAHQSHMARAVRRVLGVAPADLRPPGR